MEDKQNKSKKQKHKTTGNKRLKKESNQLQNTTQDTTDINDITKNIENITIDTEEDDNQ